MGNGEKKEKEKASCRGVTSEDGACVRVLCVFQGPDFCVCVCVQVRRNVKCVSPPCVFFFEVRRVSRPSITLRARHRFFSPRRFFCKPEQQHVDQNPRVSFMKSQCDIF